VVADSAQLVRERMLALALLMYVPICRSPYRLSSGMCWPVAVHLPLRWILLAIGIGSGAFSVSLMWSPARGPEGNAESPKVPVMHWNVQWGGARGPESLAQLLTTLQAYQPEVVCSSEAPAVDLQRASAAWAASSWHIASVEHFPPSAYWFRLTVLSRQPVAVRREWNLRAGHAALFDVALSRARCASSWCFRCHGRCSVPGVGPPVPSP
jgi:hypothetical protein